MTEGVKQLPQKAGIREEFLIDRQGKQYVLYAGLLDVAHRRGLKGIETELVRVPTEANGRTAICKAVVTMEDGRTFSGIGDASPDNVGRNIAPHIIRMAECVPQSTQALTRDGWKYPYELTVGEEMLAYDKEEDLCQWVPLLDVRWFASSPLVRLSSRSFDAVCTPDHRWIVQSVGHNGKRTRKARHTHELKTSDSIVVAAPSEGGEHPLSARDAAVLGWLATDGSLRYQRVGDFGPYPRAYIQQSKSEYVTEIRNLLREDAYEAMEEPREGGRGIMATKTSHRFGLKSEYLYGLLSRAGLMDWPDLIPLVTRLSASARAAMLDAMLKGDGHWKRGRHRIFGKGRKYGVMEAFEILATLEGVALGIATRATRGDVPLRTLRSSRLINTNYLKSLPEEPEAVWCPSTELGTWVMRDANGTISITHNTRSKARALRDAVNAGAALLEDEPDDVEPEPVLEKRHSYTPEHTRLTTEIQRALYRIPQEVRDEKGLADSVVFAQAARGEEWAAEVLRKIQGYAREAGMLPSEAEKEETEDQSGVMPEDLITLVKVLDAAYGGESGTMSGSEWYEENVLGHPLTDLSPTYVKRLIEELSEKGAKA